MTSLRHPPEARKPWVLSPACKCGSANGYIFKSGDQNTLWCLDCGTYQNRNVPKRETGEATRSVRSRDDMKPSTRARILDRDGRRCCGCGAHPPGVLLHVGHILSVEDAEALRADGVPVRDEDLNSDHNLFTVCDECNIGQAGRSYFLRTAYFVLRANVERAKGGR